MAAKKTKRPAKPDPRQRYVDRHEIRPSTSNAPATRREVLIIMGMAGTSYETTMRVLRDDPVKSEGTRQIVLRAFDWVRKNEPTLRLAVQP